MNTEQIDTSRLEGFLAAYIQDKVALDLTIRPNPDPSARKWIIIRGEQGVLLINPMAFGDHFCVDLHTFVNHEGARGGVFGMEAGYRFTFAEEEVKGTSYGWPAASLVTVLVGEQKEASS